MGLLSWWNRNGSPSAPHPNADPPVTAGEDSPAPGMNGATEVRRPAAEVTVFEFGSASAEKVTLAGYCPVSDELEPCRWVVFPAAAESQSDGPLFRVIF